MASPKFDPAPAKPKDYQDAGLGDTYFYDSVGTTLRKRRQELELSLGEVTRETKIRRHYLEAIEGNNWRVLPHTVHVLGFIRQYASLLGLDSQVASAKYLLERGPLLNQPGKPRPVPIRPPIVGSRVLVRAGLGLMILVVAVYLGLQLSTLAAPPPLEITEPPADHQTTSQVIEIAGSTDPSASVDVNGSAVLVDEEGRFSTTLSLDEGLNVVQVESRNRAGKVSRSERSILLTDENR